jgi:hypothetical protein
MRHETRDADIARAYLIGLKPVPSLGLGGIVNLFLHSHYRFPAQCTGFLQLPLEVRNKVYRIALRLIAGGVHFCAQNHAKYACRCLSKPFTPGILATCKQISEEAQAVLYFRYYFQFRHPQTLFEFAEDIGPANCRRLRAIWLRDVLKSLYFDNVHGTFEAWKDALQRITSFRGIEIICVEERLSTRTGITTCIPRTLHEALQSVFYRRLGRRFILNDGCLILENLAIPTGHQDRYCRYYGEVCVTPLMVLSRRQVEYYMGRSLLW